MASQPEDPAQAAARPAAADPSIAPTRSLLWTLQEALRVELAIVLRDHVEQNVETAALAKVIRMLAENPHTSPDTALVVLRLIVFEVNAYEKKDGQEDNLALAVLLGGLRRVTFGVHEDEDEDDYEDEDEEKDALPAGDAAGQVKKEVVSLPAPRLEREVEETCAQLMMALLRLTERRTPSYSPMAKGVAKFLKSMMQEQPHIGQHPCTGSLASMAAPALLAAWTRTKISNPVGWSNWARPKAFAFLSRQYPLVEIARNALRGMLINGVLLNDNVMKDQEKTFRSYVSRFFSVWYQRDVAHLQPRTKDSDPELTNHLVSAVMSTQTNRTSLSVRVSLALSLADCAFVRWCEDVSAGGINSPGLSCGKLHWISDAEVQGWLRDANTSGLLLSDSEAISVIAIRQGWGNTRSVRLKKYRIDDLQGVKASAGEYPSRMKVCFSASSVASDLKTDYNATMTTAEALALLKAVKDNDKGAECVPAPDEEGARKRQRV